MNDQIKEDDKDHLDLMPIKQRVSALSQRCSALRKETNDEEKKLERVVNEITTFDTATEELRSYLDSVFDRLDHLEPIHNDAEVVNKQLIEVKVRQLVVLSSPFRIACSFFPKATRSAQSFI